MASPRAGGMMASRSSLNRRALGFVEAWWLPAALVAAWWFATAGSTNFYFPPLQRILEVLWRDLSSGLLVGYLGVSLANMAAGLAIAISLGIGLGLVIGEYSAVRRAATPTMNFLRAIPPAAIVPIVIISMGIGPAPKVFIIALTCFWPVLLNTIDGVRGIQPQLLDTARAFRTPRRLYFSNVLLMAALPQIMAGVRVAVAVSLVLMVISEFFGASAGLGYYINDTKQRFAMAETWAGTLLVGILGYVLSAAFLRTERWLLGWYFRDAEAAGVAAR
jgi:ABC-type nitrate/sulfonate/bicarbonate transport system permease component